MVQINRTLWADRLTEQTLQVTIKNDCMAALTLHDLAALRELLTGEGIGSCHHCGVLVLTASQCERAPVFGVWQWVCPTCHHPISPFPY